MPKLNKALEENYLEYTRENVRAREDYLEGIRQSDYRTVDTAAADNKSKQAIREIYKRMIAPDSDTPYFIRVDLANGEIRYYGFIKLNQEIGTPIPESHKAVVEGILILSTRSDGKGYIADYAENLPDLVARTRYEIREGRLIKYTEENFGNKGQGSKIVAEDMVAESMQQTREKKMKPVSSTLQPDQFQITREPITHSLAIQGPPGSGKTVVLLERLARIAYADQNVANKGMLLIGPNKAFMEYVSQVLPMMGEFSIALKSIDEISSFSAQVNSPMQESNDLLYLKGSDTMRELLDNLVSRQSRILSKTAFVRVADMTIEFSPRDSYELLLEIEEEGGRTFYQKRKYAESRVRSILVDRFQKSWINERGDLRTIPGDPNQLVNQESAFRTIIRNLFPNIDPVGLLAKLKSDAAYFLELAETTCDLDECFAWIAESETNAQLITPSDVPILDYLDSLINESTQKWGHIAVDEAQDLAPLELAMVARRLDKEASVSLAGDLAQATGAHYYEEWGTILDVLGLGEEFTQRELTTSYRVPAEIIEYAHQFLELSGVNVKASQPFLRKENSLIFTTLSENKLRCDEAIAKAKSNLNEEESTLIIASVADRTTISKNQFAVVGKAHVSILDPRDVKGLEFDHVIILNPESLIEDLGWAKSRLARLFYVLATRSTTTLTLIGNDLKGLKEPLYLCEDDEGSDEISFDSDEGFLDEVEVVPNVESVDEDVISIAEENLVQSETTNKFKVYSGVDISILELCQKFNINIKQASGDFLIGQWLFAGNGQIRCAECREKPQAVFVKHRGSDTGKTLASHSVALACSNCCFIREYSESVFGPLQKLNEELNIPRLLKDECKGCQP
jgi:DNA helicase IV